MSLPRPLWLLLRRAVPLRESMEVLKRQTKRYVRAHVAVEAANSPRLILSNYREPFMP